MAYVLYNQKDKTVAALGEHPVPPGIYTDVDTLLIEFMEDGTPIPLKDVLPNGYRDKDFHRLHFIDQKLVLQTTPISEYDVRAMRDARLKESDAWVLPDFPLPEGITLEIVKEYRQKLRDIPQQEGFPQKTAMPLRLFR